MTRSDRHGGREQAFTIIEVIVAFVVIAIVAVGATSLIATSSKTSGRTKVMDRQRAIADALLEKAVSNTAWIEQHRCTTGRCGGAEAAIVAANQPLLDEKDETIAHTAVMTIVGRDLANDGGDGRADLFDLKVTITTTAPTTIGEFQPYTATATLDAAVRETTGSVVVRSCEVVTQIDERLATGMCIRDGSETYDLDPPRTPCLIAWECASFNAARTADRRFTQTIVRPLRNQRFTLTGPLPGGTTTTHSTGARSVVTIPRLEAGQYILTPNTPASRAPWYTHSVPAGDGITVTAGETEYATVLFKPMIQNLRLDVNTWDITDPAAPVLRPRASLSQTIRLFPVPSNRAPAPTGRNMGWTRITANQTDTVNIVGAMPGLYASNLLLYPGNLTAPLHNLPYLFVRTNGTTAPGRLEYRQTFCDPARRLQILRQRCDAYYPGINTHHCKIGTVEYEPCQGGEEGGSVDLTGAPGA